MAAEQDQLPPIEPLHEPWEPNPIPANIDVPGLNTNAPVQDQIEQIEQLITIKLQNIDANFARAHQILSTRVLPAVKRYAVNTEPVREAAKFWVSFYEQAAQVRIPTTDDLSVDLGQQATGSDEEAEAEAEVEHREESRMHSGMFDPNVTPSENSFAPETAAVSSTPMPYMNERVNAESAEEHDIWSESVESPLKRLDKGLKSLGEEDDSVIDYSKQGSSMAQQSMRSEASSTRPPIFTAQEKGKSKVPPTLLQNVLSKNVTGIGKDKNASPLKARKTPKKNPYVPHEFRRADWDGIVDLTKPAAPRAAPRSNEDWSSDEEDFPPPDLSPPRSAFGKRIAQIGRTPVREAAVRIGRDLVDAERLQLRQRFDTLVEPSLSATPSTPSLSMYSRHAMGMESSEQSSSMSQAHVGASNASTTDTHSSVDTVMQRFGLESNNYPERLEQGRNSGAGDASFDSFDDTPGRPVFANLNALPEEEGSSDISGDADSSFDDSFGGHTGAPSAAFLMASARQSHALDDSFEGSDQSSDSLDADDDVSAGPPIHPFAKPFNNVQDDDSFDDSLDDDDDAAAGGEEEPTVFGPQHAQRVGGQLQLLGQGLMDDTTALNSHLRQNAIPETPTPWTSGGQGGSAAL